MVQLYWATTRMGTRRVSFSNQVTYNFRVNTICRVIQNKYTIQLLKVPIEGWMGKSYRNKKAPWEERTAMFLPKASPLMVIWIYG